MIVIDMLVQVVHCALCVWKLYLICIVFVQILSEFICCIFMCILQIPIRLLLHLLLLFESGLLTSTLI